MNVSKYLGISNIIYDSKITNSLITNERHVGFEAERESFRALDIYDAVDVDSLEYLSVIGDGSLRNNGKEVIFNRPLKGINIILALGEFKKLSRSYSLTHSQRTSNHIHVNIQDFDEESVYRLYNNFLILEKTLFNLSKIKFDREANTYCIPHWYYNKVSNLKLENCIWNIFELPKYLSCRFHKDYGTIEFRMFESTNSITEILRHINICLELVELSKEIHLEPNNLLKQVDSYFKTSKYFRDFVEEYSNGYVKKVEIKRVYSDNGIYSKVLEYKRNIKVSFDKSPELLSQMLNEKTGKTLLEDTAVAQILSTFNPISENEE